MKMIFCKKTHHIINIILSVVSKLCFGEVQQMSGVNYISDVDV